MDLLKTIASSDPVMAVDILNGLNLSSVEKHIISVSLGLPNEKAKKIAKVHDDVLPYAEDGDDKKSGKAFSFAYPIDYGDFEIYDGSDVYRQFTPNAEFFNKFFDPEDFGGILYKDETDDETDDNVVQPDDRNSQFREKNNIT